jgi:hypothetical protein
MVVEGEEVEDIFSIAACFDHQLIAIRETLEEPLLVGCDEKYVDLQ